MGENQLDNVRYIVERSQSANLKILMGDFNTDAISDQQAYQQIKSLGYSIPLKWQSRRIAASLWRKRLMAGKAIIKKSG